MNCFQLIKTVLDEAYSAIPGEEAKKDERIRGCLQELSLQYSELLSRGCIDYSDPCKRFAYIYRYTTSHANIVYDIISRVMRLRALFDQRKLVIACVGGGPGSDFLGILKYCLEYDKNPELKALILDRDPAWGESWADVDDKLGPDFRISTVYHPLDVTDQGNWPTFRKHFQADLFTMIYFMSEVYAVRDKAEDYFEALFNNMKSGATVLFVDNNSTSFTNWFESLAERYNIRVFSSDETTAQLPTNEEKKDLGVYYEKFDPPKLTAKIAYRVGVKS